MRAPMPKVVAPRSPMVRSKRTGTSLRLNISWMLSAMNAPRLTHHPFYERFDRTFVALHDHYGCMGVTGNFFGNLAKENI